MGHTHRCQLAFKKKKKKKNQVRSLSLESRVPETGSDPPIGSDRDSGLDNRGPIWVIQKPNIKYLDRVTISLKDSSQIVTFSQPKISPKIWIVGSTKTGQLVAVPENGP